MSIDADRSTLAVASVDPPLTGRRYNRQLHYFKTVIFPHSPQQKINSYAKAAVIWWVFSEWQKLHGTRIYVQLGHVQDNLIDW